MKRSVKSLIVDPEIIEDKESRQVINDDFDNRCDPSAILSSTDTKKFFNWYNSLEEERWSVDNIADREGIPNYNEASEEDLSWLEEQYLKELTSSKSMREEILNDLERLADSRIKGFKKYEKAA